MKYYASSKIVTNALAGKFSSRSRYHCDPKCKAANRAGNIEEIDLTTATLFKPCPRCAGKPNGLNTAAPAPQVYPFAERVVIWHCSDGRDFGSETEALWHELNMRRKP